VQDLFQWLQRVASYTLPLSRIPSKAIQTNDMLKTQIYCPLILFLLCGLVGCGKKSEIDFDDLNSMKGDFLNRVFEGELEDGPFFLNYTMSTVFFSKDLISIFGEFTRYTNFPHDSKRYEGKTFCRVNGKFREIRFDDLFSTAEQKEFIRKYCEDTLKDQAIGYFGEDPPLRDSVELTEIQSFLIHESFLVIVFQRYVVDGLNDYPTTLNIPYIILKDHINPSNPLIPILKQTVASKAFISSWKDVWGQK
jgi:hypothetical protein